MKFTSHRTSELRITAMELIQAIQNEWPKDIVIQSIPITGATVEVSTSYNAAVAVPDVVIKWGGRDHSREEARLPDDEKPGEHA